MKISIIVLVLLILVPSALASFNDLILPEEYSQEITNVLYNYSELENTTIIFREDGIKHTMQSRPKLSFLFLPKAKHIYQIIMNNGTTEKNGIPVANLNSTQLEGVLAHELAHIVDYKNKTDFGIIFLGVGYLFKNSRINTEKRVDRITIDSGFGRELISFSLYASNPNNTNVMYQKIKQKSYYSLEELIVLQEEHEKNIINQKL